MYYLLIKDKNLYNVYIVSVGVLLLLFELDEYEIIRIFIIRREKIVFLID